MDVLPVPGAVGSGRRQRPVRLRVSCSSIREAERADAPGTSVVKDIPGEAGYRIPLENPEDEKPCVSLNSFLQVGACPARQKHLFTL